MNYGGKLNNLNSLTKVAIELSNKLYKLVIEIHYSNPNSKAGLYLRPASYYSRKPRTNRQPNNGYRTVVIKLNLS